MGQIWRANIAHSLTAARAAVVCGRRSGSGVAMYTKETRVLLRHYLEQGVGKTELARRFGVHRRTVYHWIETAQRLFEEMH